jgi:hypothetical protein
MSNIIRTKLVGRARIVRLAGLGISIGNIHTMFLATSIKHCAKNVQWTPITTSSTIGAPNVQSKHLRWVKRVQLPAPIAKLVSRTHPTSLHNRFFGRLRAPLVQVWMLIPVKTWHVGQKMTAGLDGWMATTIHPMGVKSLSIATCSLTNSHTRIARLV